MGIVAQLQPLRLRDKSRLRPSLVQPQEMVPPLLYVVSPEADEVNGWRFDANLCDLVFTTVGSRPSMECAAESQVRN